jgi:hypothetical protein
MSFTYHLCLVSKSMSNLSFFVLFTMLCMLCRVFFWVAFSEASDYT